MLEDEVDEKYYLSDKMIKYISADKEKWNGSKEDTINRKIATTINTGEGSRRCDASNYVAKPYDKIMHLKQLGKNNNIKIKNATKKGYLEATEGDGIDISSRMQYHRGNVQKESIQTITTSGGNDRGVVDNVNQKLRIRKLTPKECWRLMGFDDTDFEKAAQVNSNAQLYKQAGNSIVVNVLEAILKNLLFDNK
jgi:DNA (cytosine-5)-methyltransferase 1